MSDIFERLRRYIMPSGNIKLEAADKITRLRVQLHGDIDSNQNLEKAYQAEIKGLKEDRESLRAALEGVTAERDRMRDALRRIDGMATTICMKADAGYGMKVETVMPIYETARAALEGVTAERDALAARLAPVDEDALVEIAAREIAFAQGAVESPNSEFMDENWHCWEPEARAAISAIRPHIKAAERERVENEKLREALRPFGEALKDNYSMQVDELPIIAGSNQMDIRFKWTLGDLRRARDAIKGVTENKSRMSMAAPNTIEPRT